MSQKERDDEGLRRPKDQLSRIKYATRGLAGL